MSPSSRLMCLNAWSQLAALFVEVVNIAETGQWGGGRALWAVSISAVSPSSLLPDLLGYEKPLPPSPTSGHTVPIRTHCDLKLGAKMNLLSLPAPLLTSMKANKTFSNMTLPSVTHTGSWQWRIWLCLMLKVLPETCFCNLIFFSLNIALIRAQQHVFQKSSSEKTAPYHILLSISIKLLSQSSGRW